MASRSLQLPFLLVASSLVAIATCADPPGYFTGGTMSFCYVGRSSPNSYKFHITVVTGWELGHGPCGPGCSYTDVGRETRTSRLQAIQTSGNPAFFGKWTKEMEEGVGIHTSVNLETVTQQINQNIRGRVSAVSTSLKWEQEIAHVEVDIDTQHTYTDVSLAGHAWKTFGLNQGGSSGNSGSSSREYNIQTKIYPKIRSDTMKPNSSPLALYKPVYMIELNKVNKIRLTASDKDGDLIQCRMGRNVEIRGIGTMTGVSITEDCVITVSTMQSDGYTDDSMGVIGVVLEDFNRHPIQMEGEDIHAYDPRGLSSSVLDFMVWVVADMKVPEFVSPTPASQQVFTVYAGSKLSIPLAAKPSHKSVPGTVVHEFHLLSLPDHALNTEPISDDLQRRAEKVVLSQLDWRTTQSDAGDFIIQVVAIDSAGFESLDRNYKIHVSVLPEDMGSKTDNKPYFPFFPKPGSITCLQNAVCSIPVYASPGTPGHVITSIAIVTARTQHLSIHASNVDPVKYRGVHTFRADVHFSTASLGDLPACFVATDNHGLQTEQCLQVKSYPPNPCDAMLCSASSTCVPSGQSYRCDCPPGRTGQYCTDYTDPCLSNPCLNGGTCNSKVGHFNNGYWCQCVPGFTDLTNCSTNTDECSPNPCQHGGICVDGVNQFHCDCINGFTDQTCSSSPPGNPCAAKHCDSSSICVIQNGHAVCKCPLDKADTAGGTCTAASGGTALILPAKQGPHSVQPTLRPGSEISCNVGDTCRIAVFLKGNNVNSATAVRGMTSPDLTTSVTPLKPDQLTGLPGTVTTSMSVTPSTTGRHTACLEVKDSQGAKTEDICYTINTPNPQTAGSTAGSTTGPTTNTSPGAKQFTDQTPPDGSVINCVTSQPCHFLPQTVLPPSGLCEEVTPTTAGALAFGTKKDGTTCATDILLEPTSLPTQRVCLSAGNENRCYTVNTIDDKANPGSGPCSPNRCQHGGVCVPDTSTSGYSCVCKVPYSGQDCLQVGDCSSNRCEFQGVCVANTGPQAGFSCNCQNGYSSANCRAENQDCTNEHCENGALCVMESGHPVCKCPLGKGGNGQTCHDDVTSPLTGQAVDPSKPQAVVPSPGQGTTLHCAVGSTCSVPIYLTGNPSHPPEVITGPTSPSVTAVLTPPTASNVPPGTLTSSLSVTPKGPGHHHVCVDIKQTTSSHAVDHVCYNIETSSTTPPGSTHPNTPPSGPGAAGGHFAGGNPEAGSEMRCLIGTPCHFIARTQKPPSGKCTDVRTLSVGVYAFQTTELDSDTCGTDVLVDPANLPNGGTGNACIQVGHTGEQRCFKVTSKASDPCHSHPCHKGGLCIPDSSVGSGFRCACPVPYKGTTCDQPDRCTSNRCLNQAVCTDLGTSGGFKCSCQPGYGGDDCRHVPDVCSGVQCEHGAFCLEESGHAKCECTLGKEGDVCHTDNTDVPVNPTTNQARPHAVVPTPGNGLVISCKLGESCSVPVYLTDNGGSAHPTVTTGPTSPKITADVTPPTRSVSPPDTLTSSLTVTPKEQGRHHVCVDIADGSGTADTVCYTVDVAAPSQSQTTPPHISPTGGRFAAGTPPSGSTITCRDDTPCRVTAMTQKQTPGGQCIDVDTQTIGVVTFPLPAVDSNTCAEDVLIDPDKITPNGGKLEACVQVGVGGERRCYTINSVKSAQDPCRNVNCRHGGHCIPDGAGGHTCVCPVPYSGADCRTVDSCAAKRCVNQAICSDGTSTNGFQCQCQQGYSALDCRHAPSGCSGLTCENGAICMQENGNAVCKCPLGRSGTSCNHVNTDIPVNHHADTSKPHTVVPSLGNGYQINCAVGHTCEIPVFIHNSGSNPPEVNPGFRTPGISGGITTPTPTNVSPDTLKSTLSVTPSAAGSHHICVDIKNGANVDNVCYTINTQAPNPGNQNNPNTGEKFTGTTPPAGARITCRDDRVCHVIVQTAKPTTPGAKCADVQTRSVGVYSFPAPADGQTCNTDIMLDPKHLPPSGRACVKVGTSGEERCFTVDEINHATDPCEPNNGNHAVCQHGGHCVNIQVSPLYHCVCPSFYGGAHCENDNTDVPANKSADKTKPHAVLPTLGNGLEIQCQTGTTCTIPVYVNGGGHVTAGQHTPDVHLVPQPTTPVATAQPPNSQVSTVSIHPVTDGHHRACVNVEDGSGVVEDLCYTIISTPHHSPSTSTAGPGGGQFSAETLPAGSSIRCRHGVPCSMMVHTKTQPSSHSCTPVQPTGPDVSASQSEKSSSHGTCDTTVLISPSTASTGGPICIEAGSQPNSGGEKRCYNVIPVTDQDDRCSNNPCLNGGQCVLVTSSAGYECVCPPGFLAPLCTEVSTTTDSVVTSGGSSTANGNTVSTPGSSTGGFRTSNAVSGSGSTGGSNTVPGNTGSYTAPVPGCTGGNFLQINPNVDTSKPHLTEPTLGSGSEIKCVLNAPCSLPIYVSGHTPSHLISGSSAPAALGISSGPLTHPNLPTIPPEIMMSQVTFMPKQTGRNHACVDVIQDSDSTRTDTVCFLIDTSAPHTAPTSHSPGAVPIPHFEPGTPGSGSVLNCYQGRLCHVTVAQAACPGQGPPEQVHSRSAGVTTKPFFGDPCVTDVVMDPDVLHLPNTACIQVGSNGENRCYLVAFTPDGANDPCNGQLICQNDQICVNTPARSSQSACIQRPNNMNPTHPPATSPSTDTSATSPSTDTSATSLSTDTSATSLSTSLSTDTSATSLSTDTPATSPPTYTSAPPLPTPAQCTAEREAFKRAAEAGRMRCTCRHPVTNRTYTVVRPRVPNSRLLRVGGISSAATSGLMALVGLAVALVRKLLKKLANRPAAALPASPRPVPDASFAWPETGGAGIRTQR